MAEPCKDYCIKHTENTSKIAVLESENKDIKQDIRNNHEWRIRVEGKIDKLSEKIDAKTTPISNKVFMILGGANVFVWTVGIAFAIITYLK